MSWIIRLMTLVVVVSGLSVVGVAGAPPGSGRSGQASQPNVVFILTDDMRRDDLAYMPFTRNLFRREGTTFTHALSPHPLCCPARAELLTGQYAQNNGVRHNRSSASGGYAGLRNPDNTLFRWFAREGYRSAYIGKYLNGYKGGRIPGLTHNDASVRRVYNKAGVVTWNNGRPTRRRQHQTEFVARRASGLIRSYGTSPFLIWAGFIAPHAMERSGSWVPPIPPDGYDSFRQAGHRRPPSLDLPSFNAATHHTRRAVRTSDVRTYHRARVLSLYAVDAGVRRIVRTLKREGVYRDTILVFASDNGMGLGSHRQFRKNEPYQDIVRIPLLMSGPGVPTGSNGDVVTLVDVPTTLARLAGVTPGLAQDGRDMFGVPDDRAVLIQAGTGDRPDGWLWQGVYTRRHTYVEYADGAVELFDRHVDPHELQNLQHDPAALGFRALLAEMRDCAAAGCDRRAPG